MTDTYPTTDKTLGSDLHRSRFGNVSLRDEIIHVDPYGDIADYSGLPESRPDPDHPPSRRPPGLLRDRRYREALDADHRQPVGDPRTRTRPSAEKRRRNRLERIPHTRHSRLQPDRHAFAGVPFHIKGEGNGYLLEVANLRIYIAGDTELIPEMEKLGPVDIAFLPKNLPYTMSDQMFVETARLIRPTYLYPLPLFRGRPGNAAKSVAGHSDPLRRFVNRNGTGPTVPNAHPIFRFSRTATALT